jgi:hypothetical protein
VTVPPSHGSRRPRLVGQRIFVWRPVVTGLRIDTIDPADDAGQIGSLRGAFAGRNMAALDVVSTESAGSGAGGGDRTHTPLAGLGILRLSKGCVSKRQAPPNQAFPRRIPPRSAASPGTFRNVLQVVRTTRGASSGLAAPVRYVRGPVGFCEVCPRQPKGEGVDLNPLANDH